MTNINARSPYVLSYNSTSQVTLKLWVYEGELGTDKPIVPTYTLKSTPINGVASVDISNYVKDSIDTNFYGVYTSNTLWLEYQFESEPIVVHKVFDGFTQFEDGINYDSDKLVLSSVNTFYTLENRNVKIPIDVNKAAGKTLTFFNKKGLNTFSYTFAGSTDSASQIAYIPFSNNKYFTLDGERYNVEYICEDKYTPRKVTFVNKYGALQDLYFFKNSKLSLETSEESYKANLVSGGAYSSSRHQYRTLYKQGRESLTVNSGFYPESHNELFKELLLSEKVWVDSLPVSVKDNNISFQDRLTEKNINYTLTLQFAFDKINNVSGHTTTATQETDTNAPVIDLFQSTINVEVNSSIPSGGFTAIDDVDGDITSNVVITGTVDTSTVGTYTRYFDVSDSAGNAAIQVSQTVNIVDTQAPVLTLIGDNPYTLELGSSYVEQGYNVSDNVQVSNVTTTDNLDESTIGSYSKTYNAIDSSGNLTSVIRTINVVDTTAPVITLNGSGTVILEYGTPYVELGATISDESNATLSITNNVNESVLGSYIVSYNATDSEGNTSNVIRTVSIIDTTAPVITLLGANPHTVEQNDVYVQQGATATDNYDGGLSPNITYTTDLDMSTTGTYTQVYSVTDSSGNTSTATRTIIVASDITAPQFQSASVAINLTGGMGGSTVGNFEINAVDNVGVTNFLFKMNGITKYNGTPTAGSAGSNQQASVFVTGIPTGGNVTFELTATDAAGNSNTITRIIDNSGSGGTEQ